MDGAVERTEARPTRAGSIGGWTARTARRHRCVRALAGGRRPSCGSCSRERFPAPWIMGDELHYSELAKSFAADGVMRFRETSPPSGPSIRSSSHRPGTPTVVGTAYALTKTINVLLMTIAAVPFFLWARRLVRPALALTAAVLFLLLPAALYANMVMTESAFLPAFLTSIFLAALALERPTVVSAGARGGLDRTSVRDPCAGRGARAHPADGDRDQGAPRCAG